MATPARQCSSLCLERSSREPRNRPNVWITHRYDGLKVIEDVILATRVSKGRFGEPAVYIGTVQAQRTSLQSGARHRAQRRTSAGAAS